MGDGWVDTDHLLLGILRESACPGRKAIDRCRTYVLGLALNGDRESIIASRLWPRDSTGSRSFVDGFADVEVALVEGPPERKKVCRKETEIAVTRRKVTTK